MSYLHALLIAVLQGSTELFPVSSLGHAVILPRLMGWVLNQKAPEFLPFLVVLHLGTAGALLAYFWRDWLGFARGVLGVGEVSVVRRERRVFWLICAATAPAVVLGFALEHRLRAFFGAPELAAAFLFLNGFLLFYGERIKHAGAKSLDQIGFKAALVIGACQALALIPGISRSETVHDIFQTKYIVLLFIHLYAFWYTLALALGKHIRQADILAAPLRTTVYCILEDFFCKI